MRNGKQGQDKRGGAGSQAYGAEQAAETEKGTAAQEKEQDAGGSGDIRHMDPERQPRYGTEGTDAGQQQAGDRGKRTGQKGRKAGHGKQQQRTH